MKEYACTAYIFADGLAIPEFSVSNSHRYWRFNDEHFKLPFDAVPLNPISIGNSEFNTARIEDVRAAAHG